MTLQNCIVRKFQCVYTFFNNTLMNFDIGLIHNYDSYIKTHIIYSEFDKKFIGVKGGVGG